MPGPDNLQQWLQALKDKAERERGGRHAPAGRETPAPVQKRARTHNPDFATQTSAPAPVSQARPVSPVNPVDAMDDIAPVQPVSPGSILIDILRGAMDLPSQQELRQRDLETARREQEQRRERIRKRKQAKEKRRRKQEEARKQREETEKRRREAEALLRQRRRPRSTLGMSGDLIRDLRDNPRALREAVLLVEILGPSLAERDPFQRLL